MIGSSVFRNVVYGRKFRFLKISFCHCHTDTQTQSKKPQKQTKADFSRLELKVGRIVEAWLHPDANSLYIEKVDLGETYPRTVISSLVNVIPLDELQGRIAIFASNLKPQKMRGVLSEAMIICAETNDKSQCEILEPPKDAIPGDVVTVEGFDTLEYAGSPPLIKTKVFQTIAKDLAINEVGEATYKNIAWKIRGQSCVTKSLKNTPIS